MSVNFYDYHNAISVLRSFFSDKKGYIEVPSQSRPSILAACEEPKTVCKFKVGGEEWALPQTGQMWLERDLLERPDVPGVFCITTSYRDEPNPIPGRHKRVFPMFEFESKGDILDLYELEKELLAFMKFGDSSDDYQTHSYNELCEFYKSDFIEAEQEVKMTDDFSPVVLLTDFPKRSSPFWNMKELDAPSSFNDFDTFDPNDPLFAKIDVILHGMETLGTAERSCNPEQMLKNFFDTSDGDYARIIFEKFTKERVMKEVEDFLSLDFFPRFGGGIGVDRLVRAMKIEKLI